MIIVLAGLLAVVVLIALGYPVWRGRAGAAAPAVTSVEESLAELLAQRDAAFQAIRDLQFDHEVGKITGEDLAMYEASLKQGAAESLRALDAWERAVDGELAATLERQVAARRAALARGTRPCPACGLLVLADDQYCTACGTRVEPVARPAASANGAQPACPSCGKAVAADDRFCPRCGKSLVPLATSRVQGAS